MMMVELTSVPGAALPISDLSDHLRLSSGFADDGSQDTILESCLRSALAAIEARLGKALFRRQFVLTVPTWASADNHPISVAPVTQIDAISLVSQTGDITPVDPAGFTLRPDVHCPSILATGSRLPAPGSKGSIEITFTAGFSESWSDMPADLKQATLMLAAEFYTLQPGEPRQMSAHLMRLIEPHRRLRVGGRI